MILRLLHYTTFYNNISHDNSDASSLVSLYKAWKPLEYSRSDAHGAYFYKDLTVFLYPSTNGILLRGPHERVLFNQLDFRLLTECTNEGQVHWSCKWGESSHMWASQQNPGY